LPLQHVSWSAVPIEKTRSFCEISAAGSQLSDSIPLSEIPEKACKGGERPYDIFRAEFCRKGDENMKTRFAFGLILLAASVFLFGCAGYGVLSPTKTDSVTIESLTKNWTNYTVYWTGIDIGETTGIMFDLKADDKALTGSGDRWFKVESEESLTKMVGWMKFNTLYYPSLWAMVGPDGQLYGYIYTGSKRVSMKMVEDKTMLVYGVPATLRGEGGYGMFSNY
jgi:hypothetical protein